MRTMRLHLMPLLLLVCVLAVWSFCASTCAAASPESGKEREGRASEVVSNISHPLKVLFYFMASSTEFISICAAYNTDNGEAECEEQLSLSKPQLTILCPKAASFYRLAVQQLGDQPVRVCVLQGNGSLELPPTASFKLVTLNLWQANVTHFTNHSQVFTLLEELYLGSNPDFDVSSLMQLGQLPGLGVLELSGSGKAKLDGSLMQLVKGMPDLEQLYISATNLHHLPLDIFQQNSKLKHLDVSGNELINITLKQGLIEQLTYLNISGCHLKNLEVEITSMGTAQTHRRYIDLSHNSLTSLSPSFMNFVTKNHVQLNIEGNLWNESCNLCSLYHLWKYDTEYPDLVDGAQSLHCFNLEEALKFCGWNDCPFPCMCYAGNKTVDCRNAGLIAVPYLAPSDAEILLLEGNSLSNMSGIESPVWCSLKMINADNNRITIIVPPEAVAHCTCVDNDDFSEEEHSCFPQALENLSLRNNKIKSLSHSDCHLLFSLRELYLSRNEVEHLGSNICSTFKLLEVLFLDGNKYNDLEEQDVAAYPNLRKLNLSSNYLTTLPYHIMDLMPRLTVLDVSHNMIGKFSEKTRTLDTPFISLVPASLVELDLSHNNLELINPVLRLEHIPTLEKLTIHNNPWECSCESIRESIRYLETGMFEDLKHMAMVKAVQTIKCQQPPNLKGVLIIDPKASQICKTPEAASSIFDLLVGIMIGIAFVGIIAYITFQKAPLFVCNSLRVSSTFYDGMSRRRYHVVLVHNCKDNEMVKADLVDPLRDLGYVVAWYDDIFPHGENIDADIEKAITNSQCMLVVVSWNLIEFEFGEQMIQRGLREEDREGGFKVLGLVVNDLPETQLYPALSDIIVKRTPVLRKNSDYISKICGFLPAPRPSHPSISFTSTSLYSLVLKELLRQERRAKELANQQHADLREIFESRSVGGANSLQGTVEVCESEGLSLPQPDNQITRL